jgi:tetratricopeptide (TPR) repeat protein
LSSPPSHSLPDAPLRGHIVVFTGRLWSMTRRDANAHVTRLGGTVCDDFTAKATMLVIGGVAGNRPADAREEVGSADDEPSKLRRARALNAQEPGRIGILTEDDFCALAGLPSPSSLRRQFYPLHDVLAMYPNLREDHVRYLQKWGLVRPAFRTSAGTFFSFSDLGVLRQVSGELAAGMTFQATVRSLRAERQGQLTLDFHADAEPVRIVALKPRAAGDETAGRNAGTSRSLAEEYFAIAAALDDGSAENREAAAKAYRRALEADPYLIPALINLGNLHYARDLLVEALALYERALSLSPDVFEAHFNLGNVHHDLGHFELARGCYEHALRLNPGSGEAHFYLAVTLEKMGCAMDAKPHWRAYQLLAPDGEWIDLAREFGEQGPDADQ